MKKILFTLTIVFVSYAVSIGQISAKYMPPEGKFLLILGQDLGAVGGFDAPNNNGYYENVEVVPGGVTTYTSINSLSGLYSMTNWGSGDVCGSCITDNSIYDNSVIVIGLYIVGILDDIANGDYNETIVQLGSWIKSINRPVYLRIGYEFDLQYGNDYTGYINAYRQIVNILNDELVQNYVSVWQSIGHATKSELMKWYPGDEYVEWLGYSHFDGTGEGILEIAREKDKPVLICEATPRGHDLKTEDGETVWNSWFKPLFNHIEENSDVINGLAYINADWDSQPMWNGQGWGDSRVEVDSFVLDAWLTEVTQEKWLNASSGLFDSLGYEEPTGTTHYMEENKPELYYYNGGLHILTKGPEYGSQPVDLILIDSAGRQVFQSIGHRDKSWTVKLERGFYIAILNSNNHRTTTSFYAIN